MDVFFVGEEAGEVVAVSMFSGMGGRVAVLQAKKGRWKESWNAWWLEDCFVLVSILI